MDTDQISVAVEPVLRHYTLPDDTGLLNAWLFDNARPYIKGRVLEMGSGQGGLSTLFVDQDIPMHLSDENEQNRAGLQERFGSAENVKKIHDIDFYRADFSKSYLSKLNVFSTIVALNISDHACYGKLAFENVKSFLRKEGILILTTPTSTTHYYGLSADMYEIKHYNRKNIQALLGTGFEILKIRYVIIGGDKSLKNNFGLFAVVIAQKNN